MKLTIPRKEFEARVAELRIKVWFQDADKSVEALDQMNKLLRDSGYKIRCYRTVNTYGGKNPELAVFIHGSDEVQHLVPCWDLLAVADYVEHIRPDGQSRVIKHRLGVDNSWRPYNTEPSSHSLPLVELSPEEIIHGR